MRAHWVTTATFDRQFAALDKRKRDAFRRAKDRMVASIRATTDDAKVKFQSGLDVHSLEADATPPVLAMTWAYGWFDGRAAFQMRYGTDNQDRRYAEVTWLTIGGHDRAYRKRSLRLRR